MTRFLFRKSIRQLTPSLHHDSLQASVSTEASITHQARSNVEQLTSRLKHPEELIVRYFSFGKQQECALVCMSGLSDLKMINEQIAAPLQQALSTGSPHPPFSGEELLDLLEQQFFSVLHYEASCSFEDIIVAILSGDTALIIDGIHKVVLIGSRQWTGRGVEEPQTEALVRGPREGFNESLQTNIVLVRKSLRDPNLRFDAYTIGKRAHKELVIAYVEDIAHPSIIQEIKRRVETISIDDVPESGTVEQWIEDSFLSPFPQVLHTERPDKVAAAVMQGKAAILLDGTPFALIMPTTFVSLMQSPEDYYERWQIGTLIRTLRHVAVGISLLLPSLYIALVSFHQGMIPSKLAFSIAASREGVPFPAVVEAFLMEFTLELLREAGIRLPKPVGQTIGIVGGLVIGDAAVQAGIVSPIMVIVVAVTAISSFAIPSYSAGIAFRMLRFINMIAASIFGLYGIVLSLIMMTIHMSRLRSFGVPYLTPLSPSFPRDWRDVVIRAPLLMLAKRPKFMQTQNPERMDKKEGET